MLHTWSLALEEQYYVLYPSFFVLFWVLGRRRLAICLAAVAALSLAIAEWGSVSRPVAAFYLLPTRGWELLIGALISFFQFGRNETTAPTPLAQSASLFGLALIAFAVFTFDKSTPYPGVYAVIPTAGAGLIILFAAPATVVGRLLSLRWLVGMGLISYSAYLWHQPLFAFARSRSYSGGWLFLLLATCAVALAYCTWRLVERPFRDRSRFSRKSILAGGAAVSAAMASVGLVCYAYDGFPGRLSQEQREILAFRDYPTTELYRRGRCFLIAEQSAADFSGECDGSASAADNSSRYFLWGDSFAAHLYPGLQSLPGRAIQQYTSACPPLAGLQFAYGARCNEIEAYVLAKIAAIQPDVIVLAARWAKHSKYLGNLGRTLGLLKAASSRSTIVLVGSVPEWEPSLPEVLAGAHRDLREGLYLDTPSLKKLRPFDETLMVAAKLHRARFVSPIGFLCQSGDCLAVVRNGNVLEPIAYDHGHLTDRGSVVLVNGLALDSLGETRNVGAGDR